MITPRAFFVALAFALIATISPARAETLNIHGGADHGDWAVPLPAGHWEELYRREVETEDVPALVRVALVRRGEYGGVSAFMFITLSLEPVTRDETLHSFCADPKTGPNPGAVRDDAPAGAIWCHGFNHWALMVNPDTLPGMPLLYRRAFAALAKGGPLHWGGLKRFHIVRAGPSRYLDIVYAYPPAVDGGEFSRELPRIDAIFDR